MLLLFSEVLRRKWRHMVVLAPGSAYVQGTDLLLSSRRQHAHIKPQRQSECVAPGSWLTFAVSHGLMMLTVFLDEKLHHEAEFTLPL